MIYETISGLTLFKSRQGWQLSIRPAGEDGWSIRYISDADAAQILALTNTFADHQWVTHGLPVGYRHTPTLEDLGL